jgi:hypothetical protein
MGKYDFMHVTYNKITAAREERADGDGDGCIAETREARAEKGGTSRKRRRGLS